MRKFQRCFFDPFSNFNDEKSKLKYYNKPIKTRENGNAYDNDQEESKLNSVINANSSVHTVTHD